MSVFRRRLRTLLLLASSLLVGLLLAEVAVRLLDPPESRDVRPSGLFVPSPDAAVSYTLRPGFHGQAYGAAVTINTAGLRGEETGPRRPDTFRLALVGDSVVFGFGLRDDQTLAHRLANRLAPACPADTHVEVLNLGVPGYNLEQQLELWRRRGRALAPDAVVFVLGRNDTDPAIRRSDSADRSGGFAPGAWLHELRERARAHSRLWAWVDAQLWRRTPDMARVTPLAHPLRHPLARELDVWDETRWSGFSEALAELAGAMEVPWMVAEYDGPGAFADGLEDLCVGHGVPFVPLTMAFDDVTDPRWRLTWDPHPSADAVDAMAGVLAAAVAAGDLGGAGWRDDEAAGRLERWRRRARGRNEELRLQRREAVAALPSELVLPTDAVPLAVVFGLAPDGALPYREARVVLRGPGTALRVEGHGSDGATLAVSFGPVWRPTVLAAEGSFSATLPLPGGAEPGRYLKIGLQPHGQVGLRFLRLENQP